MTYIMLNTSRLTTVSKYYLYKLLIREVHTDSSVQNTVRKENLKVKFPCFITPCPFDIIIRTTRAR